MWCPISVRFLVIAVFLSPVLLAACFLLAAICRRATHKGRSHPIPGERALMMLFRSCGVVLVRCGVVWMGAVRSVDLLRAGLARLNFHMLALVKSVY